MDRCGPGPAAFPCMLLPEARYHCWGRVACVHPTGAAWRGRGSPKILSLRDSTSAAKKCENRGVGRKASVVIVGGTARNLEKLSAGPSSAAHSAAHHPSLSISQPEGESGEVDGDSPAGHLTCLLLPTAASVPGHPLPDLPGPLHSPPHPLPQFGFKPRLSAALAQTSVRNSRKVLM